LSLWFRVLYLELWAMGCERCANGGLKKYLQKL